MWQSFGPSLVGGMLIGLAVAILMAFNGRVAGISGIAAGLFRRPNPVVAGNLAFVIGLLAGAPLYFLMFSSWPATAPVASTGWLIAAGLLVGFGSRLGSGCTSGHGVAGLAALSPRSFVAVITFLSTAVVTVFILPDISPMTALRLLIALIAGVVFGLGLSLSGMLDPRRVQGFLDITGNWDPSLAFVLGGAVIVAFIGNLLTRRWTAPVLDSEFHRPKNHRIDARLILGSAIFGIGWGIGGYCPGPALTVITVAFQPTVIFVATMVIGMLVHDTLLRRPEN